MSEKKLVEFKDKDVAAKYESTVGEDLKLVSTGYHGFLSNINLQQAAYLMAMKHYAIKEKEPAKAKS